MSYILEKKIIVYTSCNIQAFILVYIGKILSKFSFIFLYDLISQWLPEANIPHKELIPRLIRLVKIQSIIFYR